MTAESSSADRILESRRAETSQVPQIQRNAIAMHAAILMALSKRKPELARVAMDNHMAQTLDDLKSYVLRSQ